MSTNKVFSSDGTLDVSLQVVAAVKRITICCTNELLLTIPLYRSSKLFTLIYQLNPSSQIPCVVLDAIICDQLKRSYIFCLNIDLTRFQFHFNPNYVCT